MTAAAFFDLDKTIIAKSSTLAFTKPLYRAGFLSRRSLAKAAIAQAYYQSFGADHDQLDRAKVELAAMTKGWSRQEVLSLVEETVDEVVAPLAYAEALALIDSHRRAGRKVVVISASPEEIVRPLCRYLGIDDVIATRSRGRRGRPLHGNDRALRLRPGQGGGDGRNGPLRGHRPQRVFRLLRFGDRRADAGGGRPSGCSQS